MIAINKLGFHAYEDYRHHFTKKVVSFANYSF